MAAKKPKISEVPESEERAAIPPALVRDMLGIPTYDQGSVAAGAHVVARTFLSGLAAHDGGH